LGGQFHAVAPPWRRALEAALPVAPIGALADQQPSRGLRTRSFAAESRWYNAVFFNPWESIHESNPQEFLEHKEEIKLVPFLIMQAALDDNVLPSMQKNFVKTYVASGESCEYHLFENSVREWVAKPGPQTDKAREVVKAFIARELKA
jgi:hypothetical protein